MGISIAVAGAVAIVAVLARGRAIAPCAKKTRQSVAATVKVRQRRSTIVEIAWYGGELLALLLPLLHGGAFLGRICRRPRRGLGWGS
jgi:hypothetical protein